MRVAVISDTHMPRMARAIPRALREGFRSHDVELILHLGDMTSPEVPRWFEALAPFDGVAGNNDGAELRERFGRHKVIELEGRRIGLVHGDGHRGTTLRRAVATFADQPTPLDAILFGHSHVPYCERHGATWLVNPGSPTDKRRQPRFSYATIDVRRGSDLRPALHFYDDKR